ncbi:MAG: hypothetical protein KDK51_04030 [Deltaproteobacteria bacterium]|nr:hypothetical protein [Deltaproteobacteria bacterium]
MNIRNTAYSRMAGISIIELLVAGVIFIVLGSAIYTVFTRSVQRATENRLEAKSDREAIKLNDKFQYEMENAITLFTAENYALQVDRPVGCDSSGITTVNWGLRPFPGYEKARYDAQSDYNAIDPSDLTLLDGEDRDSDAVQMVYSARDSTFNRLAVDGSNNTYPTSGNNPIVVESITDLAVGDYAVILDSEMSDLFRITSIENGISGAYNIYHTSRSYWNPANFTHEYGEYDPNSAYVFRVEIADYVYDQSIETVLRDSHVYDDGFMPDTGTYEDGGAAAQAKNWEPVLTRVTGFTITYKMFDGSTTRSPVMGVLGEGCLNVDSFPDCSCVNQLGSPSLQFIDISIDRDEIGSTQITYSPVSLKKVDGNLGKNTALTGPPLYLTSPAWEKTAHPSGAGSGAQ